MTATWVREAAETDPDIELCGFYEVPCSSNFLSPFFWFVGLILEWLICGYLYASVLVEWVCAGAYVLMTSPRMNPKVPT